MTGINLIKKFRLYVDDQSEMGEDEEIDLLNDIYHQILNERPWEFLRKSTTPTTLIDSNTGYAYVNLPSDFKYMYGNYGSDTYVIFGTAKVPVKVLPISSIEEFIDQTGYAYVDKTTDRLIFTGTQAAGETVKYNYIHQPTDLSGNTEPIFDERFQMLLPYGMAADFSIINQDERGLSYQADNLRNYKRILDNMMMEDAHIKLAV